ncbi:NAD kinase [Rummeliibacillus sp. G93]|uniref:NAD kinase n=1 Tax=Rummeliibacillus stabekisii TaxID=241244 RepID=A0A143H8Y3_9BACL|nr:MULTISPECIES: NAD kinase [Rummeliibacillus]AMW98213.1 NAD kinase [Rummeliibacillus stabekisii]MBB5170104.1 NAD+ kinase [Rummeliibacillus stabekisii]MCM3315596.1 NAD kinase [Rummeliibacillus stabekisii]UQW98100.1 NAD kinase [Rummeliibacillus sp. G93]GEL04364.1 NAD kinase [Rummeliibacillus stabekisii]
MRFAVQSRNDPQSNELMERAINYLTHFGLELDEEKPEIVLSIGGDGTLLQAFHRYTHMLSEVAFVGIHTGHLGFYADWKPAEIEKLVISIAKNEFDVIEYPLLEMTINYQDNTDCFTYLALNESTVKSPEVTLVMDIELNGKLFERFRGDGLCVSTPSGSTAYNKALGGAIIHPSLETIQLTEMASINNRVFRTVGSSLVLPAHHNCVLKPVKVDDFMVTIDHIQLLHKNVKTIQYRVAKDKVRFARFRAFPFWQRVHDSFIDSDLRD